VKRYYRRGSSACSALFLGTTSVLGTLAPISGLNAGILIGRFCLRFSDFLPSIRATIPWSQVVTGMLRMSYVTDVLKELQRRFSFSDGLCRAIQFEANMMITGFRAGWFEQVLTSLSRKLSTPEAQVRDTWLRTCYFTDASNYVHFGQPEHIFVVPSPSSETHEPPAAPLAN